MVELLEEFLKWLKDASDRKRKWDIDSMSPLATIIYKSLTNEPNKWKGTSYCLQHVESGVELWITGIDYKDFKIYKGYEGFSRTEKAILYELARMVKYGTLGTQAEWITKLKGDVE